MFFVIQKINNAAYDKVQGAIIEDVLCSYKGVHEYSFMDISDLYIEDSDSNDFLPRLKDKKDFDQKYSEAIAIGNITFVETMLKIFHGIEYENAIEVPPCLREERFLKRKYSIVPAWQLPRTGKFFIKDASRQKVFSYKGDLELFLYDEMFEERKSEFDTSVHIDYEHLYQISEIVRVLAEYRVYVLGGQVDTISHFAGDPYRLPDIELIKEAVESYNKQPDSPKSYSIDIMITPRGTAITEVHNFMCLGLYNVNWDERLLYAYKDGWEYVLNHNTSQTEFTNF